MMNSNNSNNNRKMRRTRESAAPSSSSSSTSTPSTTTTSSGRSSSNSSTSVHRTNIRVTQPPPPQQQHQQQQQILPKQWSLSSAYNDYYIRGDTQSAYHAFVEAAEESTTTAQETATSGSNVASPSIATIRYNQFLLSALIQEVSPRTENPPEKSVNDVLKQLNDLESNVVIEKLIPQPQSPPTTATAAADTTDHIDTYYFTYNRALMHYGTSDYTTAIQLCTNCIRHPIQQHQLQQSYSRKTRSARDVTETKEPVPIILFHLAFLLLECVLALGVGRNDGLNHLLQINLNKDQALPFCFTIEMIVDWLEDAISSLEETENDTHHCHHPPVVEAAQIKFLIPMYKSRIALSEFDTTTKSRMEHATRSARKDMKTAMDIFHNKLRPSYTVSNQNHVNHQTNHQNPPSANTNSNHNNNNNSNSNSNETDSIASSVNSTDDRQSSSAITATTTTTTTTSTPLTKYNQSALCVKAHLEQLKGNTKKSLILCTEAAVGSTTTTTTNNSTSYSSSNNLSDAATLTDDAISTPASTLSTTTSWYDVIHANNLAVIYATNGRKHLALHGMIKALRANTATMKSNDDNEDDNNASISPANSSSLIATDKLETPFSNLFLKDGTVKSDISTTLLYNTAICCLRTRNYMSAYECMVSCICHNHPLVFHNRPRCYLYLADACIGVYAQQNNKKDDIVEPVQKHHIQALVEVNGEPKGIVLDNGSFRNNVTLVKEETLEVLGGMADLAQVKRNPLLRARSCLQHVLQAMEDSLDRDVIISARLSLCFVELAFGYYRKVRESVHAILQELQDIVSHDGKQSENIQRLHKRQIATATMYLSEANCALGDRGTALQHILGDGHDDTLNQLASHLSGVTMEQASKNESAQRRLAKAQAKVRSSAAVVAAAMGDSGMAKELAHSAKAIEDINSTSVDNSSARRALIYTSLRENNPSTTLSTLFT